MNEQIKEELFMIYVLGTEKLAKEFLQFHELDDDYSEYLGAMIHDWQSADRNNMQSESLEIFKKINGFAYPVNADHGTISDFYGNKAGRSYAHGGIDIGAKTGTPLIAGADGIVLESWNEDERKDWKKVYGNYIIVNYGNVDVWYCHCHSLSVAKGQKIYKDQIIAAVGNTGSSQGSHLHLATWKPGAVKHRNPLNGK